MGTVYLLRIKH